MRQLLYLALTAFITLPVYSATISGTVKEKKGNVLAFASILVKGTTQGVSTNGKGIYSVQLEPGEYTLLCQYIGHKAQEKKIKVGKDDQTVDFELEEQQYNLKDVEVKSGGEDPAYAIIRKAIEKREEHLKEIKQFQCEVYIKGQMQLRNYPKSFFGQKVDFEDGDTSKRKMLFLSETIAKYSVQLPEKEKVEVISTKVSGSSNSFGMSQPQIISFYENNISVGEGLNPRGFISPIANGALSYYKYKFEGTFYESGKEVSRIKVIPRRAYEPLFSGYINIIENEWRIQSVDLLLLRAQQMQYLDTLRIQQLYVPSGNVWVIKNQVIYPAGKLFGFDFFGSFVQVYDKFDMEPKFKTKFFDHTVLKFYDSSNKKTKGYWDSIRPLPLLVEEERDYKKKDSLEQVRKDPRYLDSLDKKRNKVTIVGVLLTGQSYTVRKRKETISFSSLLSSLNYNTVEGAVLNFSPSYFKRYEGEGRRSLFISPDIRYGITNGHLNPSVNASYAFGKKYFQSISIAGGRKVYQFSNAGVISERLNSLTTLFRMNNFMKIYEANFFRATYTAGIGNGLSISGSFQFQDRYPLENLPDPVDWSSNNEKSYTPNYPTDLTSTNMPRNQASVFTIGINWRPGADYIEFPDRKISIGSKYPTITASITKGINGFLGSDVDYTKWRIGVNDELNLKLAGQLNYNIGFGGFFDAAKTYIPDYQHYQGNQTIIGTGTLASYQLLPYYKWSNTATFNASLHAEYHLNGLLSNKIPGYKKLNWFFVTGIHTLHVNKQTDYLEWTFGVENIFKVLRVDFVQGIESGGGKPTGFRLTMPIL
jgi:hypothetical protein